MSHSILIIGESGSGKSTSLRNLDPKETFIINVINKPLPFKGGSKNYTPFNKEHPDGNYCSTDNPDTIKKVLKIVSEKRPEIKTIILDDFQYMMCNEFMRRAKETGYTKFTEIGQHAWEVLNELNYCRDDINCYVLSHSDTGMDGKVKCKTIGKMLEDKISMEGMFTLVLHAIVTDGKYKFMTQYDGMHLAKSPMGMFDTILIDNDLKNVNEIINKYYNDDISL